MREKLRRLEQRLAALRDRRKQLAAERDRTADALAAAPDDDASAATAAREAREAYEALAAEIEQVQENRAEVLHQLAADGWDVDAEIDDEHELPTPYSRDGLASRGERLRVSGLVRNETARQLASVATSRTPVGRVSLGSAGSREALASELTRADLAGLVQPDRRGLVAPILSPLTFLDFLPWTGTDSNSIEYVKARTLPSDTAPVSPTPEGELKPEMGPLQFEDTTDPIRTIAAWTVQKKQVLADAPFLEGLLNVLIAYEVRRALLAQILSGDGRGENVLGLLNRPDILRYVRGTEDPRENAADAIAWGIAEVQDHNLEPAVTLLNPRDIVRLRLMRDGSGGTPDTGAYLFGGPNTSPYITPWGLPGIPERNLPQGTALVADPACAMGVLRSGLEILVSDSDGDNFRRNRVTILGELRGGLVVPREEGFCAVDISAPEETP